MNLIQTLKSLGGVKPCECCEKGWAHSLHCTGQILDLAPLMAKPKELSSLVLNLINTAVTTTDFPEPETNAAVKVYVVGPQRASNLVYETARQLGATAVVAISIQEVRIKEKFLTINGEGSRTLYETVRLDMTEVRTTGYRLSLPIPPNATILFVTDGVDGVEMDSVVGAAVPDVVAFRAKGGNVLPYLLALISDRPKIIIESGNNFVMGSLPVISLHKEYKE